MRDFKKDTAGYPLGTVMMYGPTRARATKYVAAVLAKPDSDPVALKRWFVSEGDIRKDTEIADEITQFFLAHKTHEIVFSDRITGCPHEEGVDYPLGRTCPECPFWAETDRFTHGPKSPADENDLSDHISADEIIIALSEIRGCPPKVALASADVRRAELTDRLITAVEAAVENGQDATDEENHLCTHALYLLAKWREPRAFAPVLRWLALPGDGAFAIAGDVATTAGARILASVCGGDRPEIRALVENRDANEYCRSVALDSLAVLAAWGELPRATVIGYMRELITGKLEREHSFVWDEIACLIADLDAEELVPLIRQPFDDGLVDPGTIGWDDIENRTSHTERPPFEEFQHSHPPITDVADETAWWGAYERTAVKDREMGRAQDFGDESLPDYESDTPVVAQPKIGRNDQCPCGSGKKYKKCCGKNA